MKQEPSVKSSTEYAFKSYITETKGLIDSELSQLATTLLRLNIHHQIEYAILSEGKRLRPLLTILSAESVGGNRKEIMPLALAFELMHTATLVHDDIIDRDDLRRGRLAVHKKWSVSDAILTGDALIALSVELASGYGKTILKSVAKSALELCDGEHMDITFSLKTATEESYFKRIKEKSASLFKAATYSGALAGGGTPSEVHALSVFGENYGIAYQLRDDLLDWTLKENMALKDLEAGRITLPLIHVCATSNLDERRQIESKLHAILSKSQTMDDETGKKILQIISQTDSFDYCEKKIDEHLRKAVASLSALKDTEFKTYLVEMTKALKNGTALA